jgi:hypothetical protein
VSNARNWKRTPKPPCRELGLQAAVEKVTDVDQIMNMGVMFTPALAVTGSKSSGKVLSKEQVAELLKGAMTWRTAAATANRLRT